MLGADEETVPGLAHCAGLTLAPAAIANNIVVSRCVEVCSAHANSLNTKCRDSANTKPRMMQDSYESAAGKTVPGDLSAVRLCQF
jgi:hypothetical protein